MNYKSFRVQKWMCQNDLGIQILVVGYEEPSICQQTL